MRKTSDLTGHPFGRLTVRRHANTRGGGTSHAYVWDTECECGNHRLVTSAQLRNGTATECESCAAATKAQARAGAR